MTQFRYVSCSLFILVLATGLALAQAVPEPRIPPPAALDTVALADLLESVQASTQKTFLVDHRVNPTVVTAQLDMNDLDYSAFLHVLRNNGMAAVNTNNIVTIVPVGIVRQFPLPVLEEEDEEIHDEEWVTWMVFVDKAVASEMVPILRPMMPPEGHLAANAPANGIVIVDRYGNAKRIVALIREMDGATRRQR